MSKLKCPSCGSYENILRKRNINFVSPRTNKLRSISGVPCYECSSCGEDWQSPAQFKTYREMVADVDYEWLTPKQVEEFRLACPINSKKELAAFLCLNPKAFVHWEKKGAQPSKAFDLLIRLVMRSRENFDFVTNLHQKHFEFNRSDYSFLNKTPIAKNYTQLSSPPDQKKYINPKDTAPKGAVFVGQGYINFNRV